jgi:hypothetical protein
MGSANFEKTSPNNVFLCRKWAGGGVVDGMDLL